jgi:hypothetical protein
MQFRLQTLLIVLAVGPVVLAGAWLAWSDWSKTTKACQPATELDTVDYMNAFRTGRL